MTKSQPAGDGTRGFEYSLIADRHLSDEQIERALIEEIDRALDSPQRRRLPAGTLITREGASLDGIAILLEGRVRLFREVEGTEIVFHHRTAGRIIGVMALASALPASLSTSAETDVTLLPLTLQELDLALNRSPKLAMLFASALIRSLARRNLRSIRQQLEIREFAKTRIEESERLAIVGQLAADVAHELNNPLQGIMSYSHLLLERIGEGDPHRDMIEKIAAQADRSRSIIRALLDYSRPHEPKKQPIDLNVVLRESLGLMEGQVLFLNIEIVEDLDPAIPLIMADPGQIQQVLVNLIINAAEAMEGLGRLTVKSRGIHAQEVVEIEVGDTGPGIPEKNLGRVFDPFFSTKEAMHGTGLGLAISHGIVHRHQGTISVSSDMGVGTAISIRLPITADWPWQNDDDHE
ncbi:cyclic nucleotide-binding domain-containing protein [bacterium]|nr:cyclic nucleotide-binding domain-containing protein [bacterium]